MKTVKTRALRGYQARDKGTHRRYNWNASIRRYKKTGKFVYRQAGEGHRAGDKWGEQKQIDPESKIQRYGKNSPSFDEGVYQYKQRAKAKALLNKIDN